jgi:hypothetical protein
MVESERLKRIIVVMEIDRIDRELDGFRKELREVKDQGCEEIIAMIEDMIAENGNLKKLEVISPERLDERLSKFDNIRSQVQAKIIETKDKQDQEKKNGQEKRLNKVINLRTELSRLGSDLESSHPEIYIQVKGWITSMISRMNKLQTVQEIPKESVAELSQELGSFKEEVQTRINEFKEKSTQDHQIEQEKNNEYDQLKHEISQLKDLSNLYTQAEQSKLSTQKHLFTTRLTSTQSALSTLSPCPDPSIQSTLSTLSLSLPSVSTMKDMDILDRDLDNIIKRIENILSIHRIDRVGEEIERVRMGIGKDGDGVDKDIDELVEECRGLKVKEEVKGYQVEIIENKLKNIMKGIERSKFREEEVAKEKEVIMEEMNKTNNELLERIQKLENDAAAKDKQESDLIRSHISLIQNEAKTLLTSFPPQSLPPDANSPLDSLTTLIKDCSTHLLSPTPPTAPTITTLTSTLCTIMQADSINQRRENGEMRRLEGEWVGREKKRVERVGGEILGEVEREWVKRMRR